MTTPQWIEAGALVRGGLRRELTKAGIRYTETKSLTGSVFIIHEEPAVYDRLVREINAQTAEES